MARYFLSCVLILFTLLILCCTQVEVPEEPEPVVLGAMYNLRGRQSVFDIPSANCARLAVEEANRAGGVMGRPVTLVVEDCESELDVVKRKTAEVIEGNPTISALFGFSDTDMVLAAAPVAAESGRVFLTSGATSPKLPSQVPEYLFLACFGDNVQAAAGAEWAHEALSARTVSIFFNSERAYTRLLEGYFETRFKELGGEVLSIQSYKPETLQQTILELEKADLIYLSGEETGEILEAVRLLRKAGHTAPILGGDGFDSEEVWKENPDVENVFFTTHVYLGKDNPDPRVIAFLDAYEKKYPGNIPDGFAALSYDAARLLLAAIEKAQSAEPEAVRNALAGIQGFEGVTGTISYSPGSRIPKKSVAILQVDKGSLKLVKDFVPEQVPAP